MNGGLSKVFETDEGGWGSERRRREGEKEREGERERERERAEAGRANWADT